MRVGSYLGPYEVVSRLSSGGMAALYVGRRAGAEGFARHVAIKVVHRHLTRNRKFVRMFVDEARLAVRIHHPNVVHVEEFGEDRGTHYLVMEYVHGCPLSDLLCSLSERSRSLSVPLAVWVAIQVADGLHAAHQLSDGSGRPLGVVHRDISPQNVLIADQGHIKLIDFGIAKARGRSHNTEGGGSLKGKLRYMAPEQAEMGVVDRRSDIFSLGIVLWEMLAMQPAYDAKSQARLLDQAQNAEIPPPERFSPHVTPELSRVVMQALERDPRARPATALEFRRMLARAAPTAAAMDASHMSTVMGAVLGDELAARTRRLPESMSTYSREVSSSAALGLLGTVDERLEELTLSAPEAAFTTMAEESRPSAPPTSAANPMMRRRVLPPPPLRLASPQALASPSSLPNPYAAAMLPSMDEAPTVPRGDDDDDAPHADADPVSQELARSRPEVDEAPTHDEDDSERTEPDLTTSTDSVSLEKSGPRAVVRPRPTDRPKGARSPRTQSPGARGGQSSADRELVGGRSLPLRWTVSAQALRTGAARASGMLVGLSRRLAGGMHPRSARPLVKDTSASPPPVRTELGPIALGQARSELANHAPRAAVEPLAVKLNRVLRRARTTSSVQLPSGVPTPSAVPSSVSSASGWNSGERRALASAKGGWSYRVGVGLAAALMLASVGSVLWALGSSASWSRRPGAYVGSDAASRDMRPSSDAVSAGRGVPIPAGAIPSAAMPSSNMPPSEPRVVPPVVSALDAQFELPTSSVSVLPPTAAGSADWPPVGAPTERENADAPEAAVEAQRRAPQQARAAKPTRRKRSRVSSRPRRRRAPPSSRRENAIVPGVPIFQDRF